MGIPRSAKGRRAARVRRASFRASPMRPLVRKVRPQQRGRRPASAVRTRNPAARRTRTAARGISGSNQRVKVSANSTTLAACRAGPFAVPARVVQLRPRPERVPPPAGERTAGAQTEPPFTEPREGRPAGCGHRGARARAWRTGHSAEAMRRAGRGAAPRGGGGGDGEPPSSFRAMSTPVGHSRLHPLQPTQRSRASATASEVKASSPEPPRQGEPQRVRASAGDVLLVARHPVRRTHHLGIALAARPVVVAHLDRAGEPVPLGPIERGVEPPGLVAGRKAHERSIVHPGRAHDLAGVEAPGRVKGILDLLERLHHRAPEHRLVELRTHEPVAVLAGVRALVLAHHRERLLRDGPHLCARPLRP